MATKKTTSASSSASNKRQKARGSSGSRRKKSDKGEKKIGEIKLKPPPPELLRILDDLKASTGQKTASRAVLTASLAYIEQKNRIRELSHNLLLMSRKLSELSRMVRQKLELEDQIEKLAKDPNLLQGEIAPGSGSDRAPKKGGERVSIRSLFDDPDDLEELLREEEGYEDPDD